MTNPDYENDERDGALFRFWIRMGSSGSGHVREVANAIWPCTTPAEYRKALTELAEKYRINLP